jgi:hypothetical protein
LDDLVKDFQYFLDLDNTLLGYLGYLYKLHHYELLEIKKLGYLLSAVNRALYPKNLLFEIILSNNLFNKSFVGATA